jgi:phosphoribosylamine--glycine ligase
MDRQKVLIIGGGGREHAIACKLIDEGHEVIAAPGNPGIEQDGGKCVTASELNIANHVAVCDYVRRYKIDFTVVGPEKPLADGLVDQFNWRGLPIFGPSKGAAQIETSKEFCALLLRNAGVPIPQTCFYSNFITMSHAARIREDPIVLKKSGLAAGKGAEVVRRRENLEVALARLEPIAGNDSFLIQEMLEGTEMSCFYPTDGDDYKFLGSAQDYKPIGDGNTGPNTGGMGGFAPHYLYTDELREKVEATIVAPTIAALRRAGFPYTGGLYFQLMLTKQGPVVIEINCRFGDPETELLMPLLDCELLPLLMATAQTGELRNMEVRFKRQVAVGIVLASEGYPDSPKVGRVISKPELLSDGWIYSKVFHAGTKVVDGQLVTNGGRVLVAVGVASSYNTAQGMAMATADSIKFEGKYCRRDIATEAIVAQVTA